METKEKQKTIRDVLYKGTLGFLNNEIDLRNIQSIIPIEILETYMKLENIFQNSDDPFEIFHDKVYAKASNENDYSILKYNDKLSLATIIHGIKELAKYFHTSLYKNFAEFYNKAELTIYRGFPGETDKPSDLYSFTADFDYAKKFTNPFFVCLGAERGDEMNGYIVQLKVKLKDVKMYNNEMFEEEFVIDHATYDKAKKKYYKINESVK